MLGKPGTTILFDDYYDREYYKVIEKLIEPSNISGRMADFVIPAKFNHNAGLLMLLEYINNSN
jgi:hypothetical protein